MGVSEGDFAEFPECRNRLQIEGELRNIAFL
jgi:hypothetical protein